MPTEVKNPALPSTAERAAKGKSLRETVPRSSHGEWNVKKNRQSIIALLEEEERGRIQELLPLRRERMCASPFTFYRGAAVLMAADLSGTPSTGIHVQAVGDAHISNFGVFASPERRLVFDVNDFDETLPGPWEWDIKRLVTSIEICGRDRNFTRKECRQAVLEAAKSYRKAMRKFSAMGNLEVWYAHMDLEELYQSNRAELGEDAAASIHAAMQKALTRDNTKAFRKLTGLADGKLRIISDPPLIVPIRDLAGDAATHERMETVIRKALQVYRMTLPRERRFLIDQYQLVDAARKVVGVGSIGMRVWIVVLQGRADGDPLVLQVKEARESALEQYLEKSAFAEHGRRVVEGQRAIQTAGDILLGWVKLPDESGVLSDFYVRQLWDSKGSVDLENMTPAGLTAIGSMCAWTLAHAHAKTGDRHCIAAYLGKGDVFDTALQRFAESYADQNEADYASYLDYLRRTRQAK